MFGALCYKRFEIREAPRAKLSLAGIEVEMWVTFALAFIMLFILIYFPGYLFLSSLRIAKASALAFAPLPSIAVYSILATAFSAVGLSSSGYLLFGVAASASVAIFVVSRFVRKERRSLLETSDSENWLNEKKYPFIYVAISLIVVTIFFIKGLDGPASFNQAYDNGFHLSTVRTFLESGDYSSFNTGAYPAGEFSPFLSSNGFYPAAWHCLCAMLVNIIGCEITVAINALSALCAGVIFPLAMYQFILTLWQGDEGKMKLGAIITPAFSSFPLVLLTYGPLYPNLLSMCMLPCILASFISLTDVNLSSARDHVNYFLVFLLGLIACCFAQPNTVFSAAVILAPYCIYGVGKHIFDVLPVEKTARNTAIASVVVFVIIVVIWSICYSLPALQGVVTFVWPKRTSIFQAIVNVLLLSFAQGAVQLLLSLFVLVGVIKQACTDERRWVAWSYLLACFIFIVAVATDGPFKQFLAGFWYTDPYRLAATAVIVAIPIAIVGIESVWSFCIRLSKVFPQMGKTDLVLKTVFALMLLSVFVPNFVVEGVANIETAFGKIYTSVTQQNEVSSDGKVLTEDEIEFAKKALELIPEGTRIINQPNDGSVFLYPLYNANLVYRTFALPSLDGELDASVTVRQSLCEIDSNPEVQGAVSELGAEYVLLLDAGGERDGRAWQWSYYESQWVGLNGINDETPGFEVMLADGDMRLYRITR